MDVCAGLLQGERCVPSPLQVLFPEKEGVREMSFKKNKKKKKTMLEREYLELLVPWDESFQV